MIQQGRRDPVKPGKSAVSVKNYRQNVCIACLIGVVVCCVPADASAQTDDAVDNQDTVIIPITPIPKLIPSWQLNFRPRERPGIRLGEYLFMEIPTVGAGVKYEFQDETRENNTEKTTELYHEFTEKVGFRTTGWVYNPALCSFTATLEPELAQRYEEDAAGNSASSNLFTPDYLLSATFLNKKPYIVNLHANRREMPSWAAYKGGFKTRTHDLGGDIRVDISRLLHTDNMYSTRLGYNRYDTTTTGFYQQDDINDLVFFSVQQQGAALKTYFDTTFTDDLRTTDGIERSTKTLDSKLTTNYLFRSTNRIDLNGIMSYRDQDLDTVDMQIFRLVERLNWRHRKNLTSFYRFNYTYQDTNGDNGSHRVDLEGRLQHTLFENLTSTVGADTSYNAFINGQNFSVDPYLQFQYTRPTSIGGFSLGSRWDYLLTNRDFESSLTELTVQSEVQQLSFSQDTYLDNYNIDVSTIIVTNRAGTIQYIEGIDYQVDVVGNYVSIRGLSLGDIENGQEVLVNYRYRQDSAYDDGIFSQQYTLGYNFFNTTRVQLSFARANQTILNGIPPGVLVDDTVSGANIQHTMDWSTTRLEVERVDRSLSDLVYTTWQGTQRFSFNLFRNLNCTLAGYYGETYYDQSADSRADSTSWGGTVGGNWRIGQGLSFNLEGFTNRVESSLEETVNTGVRSELTYTYRIWSTRLSYQLTKQSIDSDVSHSSRLRNFVRLDLVRLYW